MAEDFRYRNQRCKIEHQNDSRQLFKLDKTFKHSTDQPYHSVTQQCPFQGLEVPLACPCIISHPSFSISCLLICSSRTVHQPPVISDSRVRAGWCIGDFDMHFLLQTS